jgi:hypothetical protein
MIPLAVPTLVKFMFIKKTAPKVHAAMATIITGETTYITRLAAALSPSMADEVSSRLKFRPI